MIVSKCVFFAMFLLTLFCANSAFAGEGISVYFLTPQGSRLVKTWSDSDLQKLVKSGVGTSGDISINRFFEESAKDLDWKDRADIDLLNVYGQKPQELVRLPRFMVVRDKVKFRYFRLSGRVSLEMVSRPAEVSVPRSVLELHSIRKIELTLKSHVYPGLHLKVRTNPAASRGEKLFTQNCLSCHSVPGVKPLSPKMLQKPTLEQFASQHTTYKDLVLSPKDVRGLDAYREALGSEKNGVVSP